MAANTYLHSAFTIYREIGDQVVTMASGISQGIAIVYTMRTIGTLITICYLLPTTAQWTVVADSLLPLADMVSHRTYAIKIAPDRSVWVISNNIYTVYEKPTDAPLLHLSGDEGGTWVSRKIGKDSITHIVTDVSPLNQETAYIAANEEGLLYTSNGGQTWERVASYPYHATLVHFFDQYAGWVYSETDSAKIITHSVTKDGGRTWTHFGGKDWVQPSGTGLPPWDSVEELGRSWVWTSAYEVVTDTIFLGMRFGNYLVSRDRGHHWEFVRTPLADSLRSINAIAARDVNTIMVAGNFSASRQAKHGRHTLCYVTRDGGRSWNQSFPPVAACASHYLPGSDSVFVMAGHNDFGWGGGKGTVISTDFGRTWDFLDRNRILGMDFLDIDYGFASCWNVTSWTTASGKIYKWAPHIQRSNLVLWLAGIAILVSGTLLIRMRQIHKRDSLKQQMANLEREALQAQMNPHFVFNALNALQSYINHNEVSKSNVFLTHFSKMVRGSLNVANQPKTTLRVELDMLSSYLELEKMRFNNSFSFTINVSPNIDTDQITIPPMITQPLLENAVKHGIRHADGNGLIELNYRLENDYLVISVSDNGVGFYHSRKHEGHTSHGLENVLRRLKLIHPKNDMEIREVPGDHGKPAGTVIIQYIYLPV